MGNGYSNKIAESSAMDPIPMEDLIVWGAEWKEGHIKNFSILRSVSGITSTISSSALIWMITRSHKGLSTTQHRILLGLSICDLISSLCWSTFNVLAPSENGYSAWNSRGNEATCDAQGFLNFFGIIGGLFYNATLNVYYMTVVKFTKNEDYIRTKIEPFLHGVPIVLALTGSIVGIVRNHFNDDGFGLCNSSFYYPLHCQGYDIGEIRDGFEIPCGRGIEGAEKYTIFGLVCLFIAAVIIISSVVIIYRAVKKQEKKLSRYGVSALTTNSPHLEGRVSLWKRIKLTLCRSSAYSSNAHRPAIRRSNNVQSRSRAIMHRAIQYSFAWFLSFGIYLIVVSSGGRYSILGNYFTSIFVPLQGLFNLCIYMYPKVISARKARHGREKISWCMAISEAFWSRGKKRTWKRKNHPKNQRKNLRGNRNPLQERKNRNCINKIPGKKAYCRDPCQEEEEKSEIQPPKNMVPTRHNVVDMTYAPNPTPPITDTHPVIYPEVKDIVEDGAFKTTSSEGGGDGKEFFLEGLDVDDNTKDEAIIDEVQIAHVPEG